MAQTARATSNVESINTSALQTSITALKAKFVDGATISAADINSIANIYNTIIGHTHSVTEYAFSAFGNVNDWGTTFATATSTGIKGVASTGSSRAAGGLIYASEQKALADAINAIKSHTHSITDRYWVDDNGNQ